jgi:hypothetical protein
MSTSFRAALDEQISSSRNYLIAGARHDLAVIGGESDAKNVVLVADEAAGGGALVQVPEAQGVVPRGGQSELAVRRDDDIGDEVAVAVKALLGNAVVALLVGQVPDDDGLVCKASNCNMLVSWVKDC